MSFFERMREQFDAWTQGASLFAIGLMIGVVQVASSAEMVPLRRAVAHAVMTGGLAMSASAIRVWFPEADMFTLLGVAAMIASLGATAIQNLLVKMIGRGK